MSTSLRHYTRGYDQVSLYEGSNSTRRFCHYDHQGTTQCLSDDTGMVTDRYAADAWGVEVKRDGTSINRQWYVGNAGYSRDLAQPIDYVRMRYYRASTACWLSKDPAGFMDESRYSYAAATPMRLTDPTGLKACCCCCVDYIAVVAIYKINCPPRDAKAHIGSYGWMFMVEIGLSNQHADVDGYSDCTLAWYEGVVPEDPIRGGFYDGVKTDPGSAMWNCWFTKRSKSCSTAKEKVYIVDLPFESVSAATKRETKYLDIRIVVESGKDPNCKCPTSKINRALKFKWQLTNKGVDPDNSWMETEGKRESDLKSITCAGFDSLWQDTKYGKDNGCGGPNAISEKWLK